MVGVTDSVFVGIAVCMVGVIHADIVAVFMLILSHLNVVDKVDTTTLLSDIMSQ